MSKKDTTASDLIWAEKTVPIKELRPYERNPRRITKEQLETLTDSIARLGQFRPLLCSHDMALVGGHQRLKVFKKLGWKEVRVSFPNRKLTEAEFREALIRDNVENGTWDVEVLAEDYTPEELGEYGVPIEFLTGDEPEGQPIEDDEDDEKPQNTIIQYNIIFDTEDQQKIWFNWVRKLKELYPGSDTVAARIIQAIQDSE